MYIPSLDGIRALSVALVFLSHAGFGHILPGGFGVTVFFFLSGFLITTLLLREERATGGVALGAFYMRRVLRLGPPLVLTLGGAILLVTSGALEGDIHWPTIFSQFFFYFNYLTIYGGGEHIPGTGVFWSLSVEEHFYMLWPLAVIWLARRGLPLRWIVLALVVVPLWRWLRFETMDHSFEAIYYGTDTRLDSLLFGCLLAVMDRRGLSARLFPGGWAMAGWMALALAGLLATFLWRDESFRAVWRYSLQGACLVPIFYYAIARSELFLFRPLNWAPMRRIGIYSYTIYLGHSVILHVLVQAGIAEGSALQLLLGSALSIGWAAAVYHFVEVPLLPLRKSFTARKSATPA